MDFDTTKNTFGSKYTQHSRYVKLYKLTVEK